MTFDATMTNGRTFLLAARRSRFFFRDDPPPVIGESLQEKHVLARRGWVPGARGIQIGWSLHGQVRIIRLEDGPEIAAWLDETRPAPRNGNADSRGYEA